jgi:allophanate hydrolase
VTARAAVERFATGVAAVDRPEVWIHLRPLAELRAEADELDRRVAAGEALPLAGRLLAVKDNIDVAWCPTTAAAPSYAYEPAVDAPAVARLRAAGALVVGKTNLDQFATGLVGTRSPYGAVRHAQDPTRISGGSSSGSAVAVALALVDLALGTDTAGSGRVPAALHGLWGLKPTRGLVPTTGVVPACASLDCVTVFAREPRLAAQAVALMTGPDGVDPLAARPRPPAEPASVLVVPTEAELEDLAPGWREAFERVVAAARSAGLRVEERSIAPLLDAARMLYESSFVAERYAAVGAHVDAVLAAGGEGLDPTVAGIIHAAGDHTAAQLFADQRTLAVRAMAAHDVLSDAVAVLTPTTTWHPTLDEVAADPVGANARMGRYTNFANLLDLAAVAFPAGRVAGLPFGAMLTGPAFSDDRLLVVAGRIAAALEAALLAAQDAAPDSVQVAPSAEPAPEPDGASPGDVPLLVVGAHRTGQPLNHELTDRGARLVGPVETAPCYRLHALRTQPPKPGLVRVGEDGVGGGASIVGELWRLSPAALGGLLVATPPPMTFGTVELSDGSSVTGFLCEPLALADATDISAHRDWVAWRSAGSP